MIQHHCNTVSIIYTLFIRGSDIKSVSKNGYLGINSFLLLAKCFVCLGGGGRVVFLGGGGFCFFFKMAIPYFHDFESSCCCFHHLGF